MLADWLEEITIGYRHSPVISSRGRSGKLRAGDHAPHVGGVAGDRLRDLARSAPGHLVLTVVARENAAPMADPDGALRVLVSDAEREINGYDAVVADPGRTLAARYGLAAGGHAVIRPDGYLGVIGGRDADVAGYFTNLVG
jgi:hypothetical protein